MGTWIEEKESFLISSKPNERKEKNGRGLVLSGGKLWDFFFHVIVWGLGFGEFCQWDNNYISVKKLFSLFWAMSFICHFGSGLSKSGGKVYCVRE